MSVFTLTGSFPTASATKLVASGVQAASWVVKVFDSNNNQLSQASVPYTDTPPDEGVPFTAEGISAELGDVLRVTVQTLDNLGVGLDSGQAADITVQLTPVELTFQSTSGAPGNAVFTQTA
jgi:hypothetical protein